MSFFPDEDGGEREPNRSKLRTAESAQEECIASCLLIDVQRNIQSTGQAASQINHCRHEMNVADMWQVYLQVCRDSIFSNRRELIRGDVHAFFIGDPVQRIAVAIVRRRAEQDSAAHVIARIRFEREILAANRKIYPIAHCGAC